MSSQTRLKPEKFASLNVAKYQRILDKDLARLSMRSTLKDYVAIKYYMFGGKRQSIILFVDREDEEWTSIINEAIKKGKKHAFGKCKIVSRIDKDGNGEEDITIGIKTAEGTMGKKYVVKMLNEDLFEDDPDAEVVLLKDVGKAEESVEEIRNMRKKEKGDSTQTAGSSGNSFYSKLSKGHQDRNILERFEGVMGDALGELDASGLFEEAKSKMVALKKVHEEHLSKSSYDETVLPLVESTDSYLDLKLELLREVLNEGAAVQAFYNEKMNTLQFPSIAKGNEKAVAQQVGIIRKLILRLEKLEGTLEDFFNLDNETDQLDGYNEITHDWQNYQKNTPSTGEGKMTILLEIENEIRTWISAFGENSKKATTVQKTKLNELLVTVQSTKSEIGGLDKEKVEKFNKIKQKEIELDNLNQRDFVNRIKVATELEALISTYESSYL